MLAVIAAVIHIVTADRIYFMIPVTAELRLMLVHDSEDRLAITMVQTERGCYLLTLVGSLNNDNDFNQKLQIYKQGLLSFATL